ncbi:MAG: YtxH domain-containing protein [Thermotogae bacterium]|nr:YtxH domain-containing protein [Thermotogota bacterium]
MKRGTALLAFAAGVVVGTLATLLLTPYTGDEVRGKLKEESDRLLDRLVESLGRFEELKERLEEGAFSMEEEI